MAFLDKVINHFSKSQDSLLLRKVYSVERF